MMAGHKLAAAGRSAEMGTDRTLSMPCPLQGWRNMESFDNIWKLVGVPVITVQLRYNGWVTEMQVLFLPASAPHSVPSAVFPQCGVLQTPQPLCSAAQ